MNAVPTHVTSPQLRRWFRLLTGALALLVSLVAAEFLLRLRAARIQDSDRLDPGLIRPDPFLGWRLTPGWSGTHAHYDFQVQYRIGTDGLRASGSTPDRHSAAPLQAFVGDSFTFGVGVSDSETFVALLNRQTPERGAFVNFGVPGYSTDQEALLIEQSVLDREPAVIWLVVYLANDFFDNQRAVPLQVRLPKPWFEWREGRLELRNSPVDPTLVTGPISKVDPRGALAEAVFGSGDGPPGLMARLAERSALAAQIVGPYVPPPDRRAEFAARFVPTIELFNRIVERIADKCRTADVRLRLVLLPGRSFVEQPESPSAQYQDCLRLATLRIAAERQLLAVDVAKGMLERRTSDRTRWFHPNDGHLTPRGHEVVAETLATAMRP